MPHHAAITHPKHKQKTEAEARAAIDYVRQNKRNVAEIKGFNPQITAEEQHRQQEQQEELEKMKKDLEVTIYKALGKDGAKYRGQAFLSGDQLEEIRKDAIGQIFDESYLTLSKKNKLDRNLHQKKVSSQLKQIAKAQLSMSDESITVGAPSQYLDPDMRNQGDDSGRRRNAEESGRDIKTSPSHVRPPPEKAAKEVMLKTGPEFFKVPFQPITQLPEIDESTHQSKKETIQSSNLQTFDHTPMHSGHNVLSVDPVEAITNEVKDKKLLEFIEGQQHLHFAKPTLSGKEQLLSFEETEFKNSRVSNPFSHRLERPRRTVNRSYLLDALDDESTPFLEERALTQRRSTSQAGQVQQVPNYKKNPQLYIDTMNREIEREIDLRLQGDAAIQN